MDKQALLDIVYGSTVIFLVLALSAVCAATFYAAYQGEWIAVSAVIFSYFIGITAGSLKRK